MTTSMSKCDNSSYTSSVSVISRHFFYFFHHTRPQRLVSSFPDSRYRRIAIICSVALLTPPSTHCTNCCTRMLLTRLVHAGCRYSLRLRNHHVSVLHSPRHLRVSRSHPSERLQLRQQDRQYLSLLLEKDWV